MRLEAVTVCVDYADFLDAVAPFNAPLLDRWIVVTSSTDHATQHVCRRHGLQCLISDEHRKNGDTFNKGRLIERGLHHLSADSWRLHLDGDICLPSRFRRLLDQAHLDESSIYGADRVMIRGFAAWQRLLASGWLQGQTRRYPYAVDVPAGFSLGDRWASEAGYVPIGFFQLWHGGQDEQYGVRVRPYPQHHGTACRTDVQHALQWDRRKRALIPEILVAHLESESLGNGANWSGRKTKPFGPALVTHTHTGPS